MLKKLLSIFVALSLLCASLTVSANQTADVPGGASEIKIQLLKVIGVVSSDPTDSPVTRGDFARMLCAVANITAEGSSANANFSDVPASSQHAPYINSVAVLKIMNGTGDGTFKPNATISALDASTALVRAIGYRAYAEAKGGYPYGYQSVAYDCGLFADTDAAKSFITDTDAVNMCYAAVTAPVLVTDGIGSDYSSYKSHPGRTVLTEYHGIYYGEGVVTATAFTQIDSSEFVCSKNQISIEKEIFSVAGDFDSLLGKRCEFFYKAENTVSTIIAAAEMEEYNKTASFDNDDVEQFSRNVISYYDGNKSVKARLSDDFSVILNGRYYSDFTGFSNMDLNDSEFELVSNNGDNAYDIVFVKKCETFFVNSVDPVDFAMYFDSGKLVFNPHDENSKFVIYNVLEDGSLVLTDIVALSAGDCVNIYRSSDGRCAEVYISKNVVRDSIIEYDGSGSVALKTLGVRDIASSCTDAGDYVGDAVNIHLDAFGRVAKIESTTDKYGYSYGYLVAASQPQGLGSHAQLLLYTGSATEVTLDDTFILDGIAGVTLASRPEALFDSDGIIRQVIRYQTNKKGYVSAIDTVNQVTQSMEHDTLKQIANGTYLYSNSSKGFGQNYKIGGKTLLVGMPTSGLDEVENYTSSIPFTHMTGHPIQVYDLDEDFLPCVIVYESGSSKATTALNDESPHGVVVEITRSLNYDGDTVDCIKMMTDSKIVKYCVSNELASYSDSLSEAPTVRPGDVILYSLNTVGEIGNIARRNSLTGAVPDAPYNSSFEVHLGRVYSKHKTHFTMIDGNIEIGEPLDDDIENKLTLIPLSGGNVYYAVIGTDSDGDYFVKDITVGTMENMITARENLGNESVVYARVYAYGRNFETVIYKFEN